MGRDVMKVFAGARGSGKTYKLAHAVMDDEDGVLVCESDLVEWNESEYPEIVGRVVDKNEVQNLPTRTVLYIDDTHDGDDLIWTESYKIGAVAVNPAPGMALPPEVLDQLDRAIEAMENGKGSVHPRQRRIN